ncbi:hypothetical protein MRX96_041708 [Rhipicephalus microplus]
MKVSTAAKLAIRILSAPFVGAWYLARPGLLATMRVVARTLTLISTSHSCRAINVVTAVVTFSALSQCYEGEFGGADTSAWILGAHILAISALACIHSNQLCCATTSEEPPRESRDNADPGRSIQSIVRQRIRDLRPPSPAQGTHARPTLIIRPIGWSVAGDIVKDAAVPVTATTIDFSGLYFNFDVTREGRLVVLVDGPLMEYDAGLPTHVVVSSYDGQPLDVVLTAARDGASLETFFGGPLDAPSADQFDLPPLAQLLEAVGMKMAYEEIFARVDTTATARHGDVRVLHVVVRRL